MYSHVLLPVSFLYPSVLGSELMNRNKHIMIDLGTGNNNKMYVDPRTGKKKLICSNWAMGDKQEVSSHMRRFRSELMDR
jgi:hypothetical protein